MIKIVQRMANDIAILEISGSMSRGHGSVELRQKFDDLLGAGKRKVLLNLVDVRFMDSAAIGETVGGHKRLEAAGGALKVVAAPRSNPHELMRLVALDEVLDLHPSESEALGSFGPAAG
jgi:anti-sigma B factor antagonist